MFANANRGIFANGFGSRQGPRRDEGHPNQQGEQARTHRTREHPAQGQTGDGLKVFLFVHEHDREQNQHIHRSHVDQHLGRRHKAGVEHQVEARNREEHTPKQERGIHDVGQEHHTQGTQHQGGRKDHKTNQLGGGGNGHEGVSSVVGVAGVVGVTWGKVASTSSGSLPARGALGSTPWGSMTPLGR